MPKRLPICLPILPPRLAAPTRLDPWTGRQARADRATRTAYLAFLILLGAFMATTRPSPAGESRRDDNDARLAALPEGAALLPESWTTDFAWHDPHECGAPPAMKPEAQGEAGDAAGDGGAIGPVLTLRNHTKPEKDWGILLTYRNAKPLRKGDTVLIRFRARAAQTSTEQSTGFTNIQMVGQGETRNYWIVRDVTITPEWRWYYIGGQVGKDANDPKRTDHAPGSVDLLFLLGYAPQTLEIADLHWTNYGPEVDPKALPITRVDYAGRAEDAPWRAAAAARIEKHRKGDLTVTVVDPAGAPVPGATVRAAMTRHAFPFGTAVNRWALLNPKNEKYRTELLRNFNAAVMENALKMPQWKENRAKSEEAVAWLRERGVPVRGHVMVWPSWKWMPKEAKALEAEPDALRAYVLDHIAEIGGAMHGKLFHWDVVNEPFTNHDLMDVLGREVMVDWFRAAAKASPGTPLFINDYGILATADRLDTGHQKAYEETIRFLIDKGAPIGGIGMQGHFGEVPTSPANLIQILDRYAAFEKPIVITEFDHITADEALQADYLRDCLTACFSHPAVEGFLMWGFVDHTHWRKNAPLFRKDWSFKPSGAMWRKLIYEDWWTDATAASDKAGAATVRGFLGDYRVTVTKDGRATEATATLARDGTALRVTLGQ